MDGELGAAVDFAVLDRASAIHVIGHRRRFPIASYLSYGLNRLNVGSHLMDGVGGMVCERARLITPGDALPAISSRDCSKDVVEIVKDAHKRGIPIMAITDSPFSPLAACAARRRRSSRRASAGVGGRGPA